MALFTDSDHVTQADLLAVDADIADIASAESLVVEGEDSIIRQAWDDCADRVTEYLVPFGSVFSPLVGLSTGLTVTVQRARLDQVVVTSKYGRRTSTIKIWLTYRALSLLFRAAINRPKGRDRYAERFQDYKAAERDAWKSVFATGLPYVTLPLSAPGATHVEGAGDFVSGSSVTAVSSGVHTGASYDVAITWTDSTAYVSQTSKGNAESAPSAIVTYTVPDNYVLSVSIAGLTAPGKTPWQGGTSEGVFATRTASHWNVYVGAAGSGKLYLQNSNPIALATTSYQLASSPALSGYQMSNGQYADATLPLQNTLLRG